MVYPLISEYTDAILSAEDNFDKLTYLRPVLDDSGHPIMSSGNFAVVYKMQDIRDGKYYAVKCFTREQDGREKAYERISSYLINKTSEYLIPVSYLKYELFVNTSQTEETEFPILLMEWVDGTPIDKYIQQYKGNPFVLYELCYNFRILAKWLKGQMFAHGDLKPDNILAKADGSLVLIDYDGMYVPAMSGENARENGTPDYRHPFMYYPFNEDIDDFALSIIALSLKIISISYGVTDRFTRGNGLLFSYYDFSNINSSDLFIYIRNLLEVDPQLSLYYTTFIKCLSKNRLYPSDFDFKDERPLNLLLNVWGNSIHHNNSDRINKGILSSNGLIYSKDGTLVIGFDENFEYNGEEIFIAEGTIGICEDAFESHKDYRLNLHFPSTLRYFNEKSLNHKFSLISWDSPWFTSFGGCILTKDKTECIIITDQYYKFDEKISIIGAYAFNSLFFYEIWPKNLQRIRPYAFYNAFIPDNLYIPEGTIYIEDHAFKCCSAKRLFLPSSLFKLGSASFSSCDNLEFIDFHPECQLTEIKDYTFCNDRKLLNIRFSDSIKKIGECAFMWCENIETISLPYSLIEIGKNAFSNESFLGEQYTSKLKNIHFNKNLKIIGEKAFANCCALENICLVSNIEIIEAYAFTNCYKIRNFEYKRIGKISKGALSRSKSEFINDDTNNNYPEDFCPLNLYISDSISEIEPGAITGCNIIGINNSNFIIDNNSLYSKNYKELIYCWENAETIEIHEGVRDLDDSIFYHKPSTIYLPNSFDTNNIKHACFAKVLVVPYHFSTQHSSDGTIIIHNRVFTDSFGVIYSEDKKTLIRFPCNLNIERYTVLDGCIRIEDYAFEGIEDFDPEFGPFYYGNNLKDIILPSTLQSIGTCAFEGCREITCINIPNNVTSISDKAFYGCFALNKISLPYSLKELGDGVFPYSLTSIICHSLNFYICHRCLLSSINELVWIPYNITELDLPSEIKYKNVECFSYPNCIVSKEGELMWVVPNVSSFSFPNTVKIIGQGTFNGNKIIKELKIPEGVIEIKEHAFGYNQNLNDVYLPNSMIKIADLHSYQSRGRKYIKFIYPKHIHVPKGTKSKFFKLLPGIIESQIIEDYE